MTISNPYQKHKQNAIISIDGDCMYRSKLFMSQNKSSQAGFTAFELIIVLIGFTIMIALLPWAYSSFIPDAEVTLPSSVRQKIINISLLKSDITSAQSQLSAYKIKYGRFPATNDCNLSISDANICLVAYQGSVFQYQPDPKSKLQNYTLYTSKKGVTRTFIITNKQTSPVATTSDD